MILRKRLKALLAMVVFTGVLSAIVIGVALGSQAAPLGASAPAGDGLPYRERSGDGESPTISFIDSPSPTCYVATEGTGTCYIQWNYLYVTSGSYVISMSVTIDDRMRAYYSGFFQSEMFVPGEITAPGYKVSCGAPASGGTGDWGNTYSYVIRARETGGLSAANYGSVTCPADIARVFVPMVQN